MDEERNNIENEELDLSNDEIDDDTNEKSEFFHNNSIENTGSNRKTYSDVYPSTRSHNLKNKAMSNPTMLRPNKNSRLNPNTYRKENDEENKKSLEDKNKNTENKDNKSNSDTTKSSNASSSIGSSIASKAKQGASSLGRGAKNAGKSLTSGFSSNREQDDSDAFNNEGRETLANAGRKIGGAIKKGFKFVWRLIPLPVKLGILLALLILFLILILIIWIASDGDSSGGGGGGYTYDYTALATTELDFLCSMTSPLNGYSVNGLGGWRWHPIYSYGKFHSGIDISTTTRDRGIYAVGGGTVVERNTGCIIGDLDCGYGWGNYVKIEHANGFTTLYAHMSQVLVSMGEEVKQGQKIGVEGTTGSSTGDHLHFEIYSDTGKWVSSNPFFDYSDEGYEYCVDKSGNYHSICDNSMTQRYMGSGTFQNICTAKKYNTNTCGESAHANAFIEYLNGWEGTHECNATEYKVYDAAGNGDITVGYGVTQAGVIRAGYIGKYIEENNWEKYFVKSGNSYNLKPVGSCYPKTIIDKIQKYAIENDFSKSVTAAEKEAGYTLKRYEHDALTDYVYLHGANMNTLVSLIKAYKEGGYQEFWDLFSSKYDSSSDGYKKRAKADFALFVTGDYTDNNLFYKRVLIDYDNYNSEGVISRANVCTSSKENITDKRQEVLDIANREYKAWPQDQYSQDQKIIKYLNSCSGNSTFNYVTHYCQGFVSYVLKQAGVYDKVAPKLGAQNCLANNFILNGSKYEAVGDAKYHTVSSGYIPKPGDLVFFDWDMASAIDIDHIGIVESVDSDGYVMTIEGNTSSDAANRYDGLGKVDKKRRSTSTIRGYLEW